MNDIGKIENAAAQIRKNIIRMTYSTGKKGAHVGGALSLAEIMAVLYTAVMKYDKDNMSDPLRDRLILSKGHSSMALYAALEQAGILTEEELMTFMKRDTRLTAHPSANPGIGIDFATGSLGMGLSLGVGTGLAMRLKGNNTSRIFVIMGDGECDEGSVWEAAMSAANYRLDNIVCLVDKNGFQYDGDTKEVMDMGDMAAKWRAFGWDVREADGHNIGELLKALDNTGGGRPAAVICNTVKGKGVSFMEAGGKDWHKGTLSDKQYEAAMAEQV